MKNFPWKEWTFDVLNIMASNVPPEGEGGGGRGGGGGGGVRGPGGSFDLQMSQVSLW